MTAANPKNPLPIYQRCRGLSLQFHDRKQDLAIYKRRDASSFVVFRVLKRKSYVFNGVTYPASEWLDIASCYTPDFREYSTYGDAEKARAKTLASSLPPAAKKARGKRKAKPSV